VIAGTKVATTQMEQFIRGHQLAKLSFKEALNLASKAWAVGHLTLAAEAREDTPSAQAIEADLAAQLALASVECAVLENNSGLPMTWRSISEAETRTILAKP
jgi:hypothetical protein